MHIMFAQHLFYRFYTRLNCRFIIRRAVLADQRLQDVSGDDGVSLDRFDQIFAHHQAGESFIYLLVQFFHRVRSPLKIEIRGK